VVIDAGCGTGLSFGPLIAGVGETGRIVAIEQSPEMIAKARERVREHGWRNVTLINAPVEEARIRVKADAALFHFTHDVLRQPKAVANVLAHVKNGARVVASGLNWGRVWALPVNLAVLVAALRSVTTFEGLGRPWSHLAAALGRMHVERMMLGAVFVASAVVARKR
jgi:SAM-dependent methyltransferase